MKENRSDYFQDQVAIITGAGGTLSSVIALDLARKGAKVVLIGRTEEKLRTVSDQIEAEGGSALVAPCDVVDEPAIQKIADRSFEQWGPCRFLINGAGGNNNKALTTNFTFDPKELEIDKPEEMRGFFDLDLEIFQDVLKINTMGTVIPCRIFGKQMARSGRGGILNFASMNSYRPLTRVPAYAMSKAAIINFTEWLSVYFAPANIRVNAVAPGFFVNDRSRKYLMTPDGELSQRGKNVMQHTPLGRFGEPRELLGCIEWLLNDEAAGFITGITVPVDGGFLASAGI
ncbi:MAG: SDR family oxidoreductase [Planctomycetia bacterium]|nr:SDR family oxidoreductase [Planctomycetia bacterium]